MREILFRGKRIGNGEWVYGSYVKAEKLNGKGAEYFIIEYAIDGSTHAVEPATVGQYTGLTDKNGKKIFEGDIVKHTFNGALYTINYKKRFAVFLGIGIKEILSTGLCDSYVMEVVGNIHDNPELLKGEGE